MSKSKKKMSNVEKKIMKVNWKPIILNGDITKYLISDEGSVYNINTKKFLTPSITRYGYSRITLSHNGRLYHKKVHRLVALAFIPNPENKPQVNHINGVKTDNRVENLEWCTSKENIQHSWRTGLHKNDLRYGMYANNAIYTDDQIHEVCKLLEKELLAPEIARLTGVKASTVNAIVQHGRWSHISKQYNIPKVRCRTRYGATKFSNETIHDVCKLLAEGKPGVYIKECTGVSSGVISEIRHHNIWKNISNQYKFPGIDFDISNKNK